MKAWISVAAAVLAAGCQAQRKPVSQQAARPSVLDVSGPPSAYTASASQPTAYVQPVDAAPIGLPPADPPAIKPAKAPALKAPPAAPAATGQTYTVRKGDTLFHIAKDHYGDGKKWQQIAAANPGISPSALRVGQKLLMP